MTKALFSSARRGDLPQQQATREHLCAALDGELGTQELRFLLRRLEHDAALVDEWSRWQLARQSLRGELSVVARGDFAGRVLGAIDGEAAVLRPVRKVAAGASARSGARGRWLRLSAGGAIAASVAVAALMMSRPVSDDMPGPASAPVGSSALTADLAQPAVLPAESAVEPANAPTAPLWLSRKNAFRYSQQASATFSGPSGTLENSPVFGRALMPYEQVRSWRTVPRADGSYLLLVNPGAAAQPVQAGQQSTH